MMMYHFVLREHIMEVEQRVLLFCSVHNPHVFLLAVTKYGKNEHATIGSILPFSSDDHLGTKNLLCHHVEGIRMYCWGKSLDS